MHKLNPEHLRFARALRSTPTDAEKLLWSCLRAQQISGARFRRQVPLGRYVADFVCFEHRLVIEIDGGQHNGSTHDAERDGWLRSQGFKVNRFWNSEVIGNMAGVLEVIGRLIASPPPQPSPVEGEGVNT